MRHSMRQSPFIFGITGWKNSGKTGLMTRLIPMLTEAGYRVSTIKHAHHSFDIDHIGTDSFRHRQAGAAEVIVASDQRIAHIEERRGSCTNLNLSALIERLGACDLVLIEGYKSEAHPKVLCHRAESGTFSLEGFTNIVAIASTDCENPDFMQYNTPIIHLDDTKSIAQMIIAAMEQA